MFTISVQKISIIVRNRAFYTNTINSHTWDNHHCYRFIVWVSFNSIWMSLSLVYHEKSLTNWHFSHTKHMIHTLENKLSQLKTNDRQIDIISPYISYRIKTCFLLLLNHITTKIVNNTRISLGIYFRFFSHSV